MDEQAELRQVMKRALTWLNSKQPPGAICFHLGINSIKDYLGFECEFCPRGYIGYPVLIFTLAKRYRANGKPIGMSKRQVKMLIQLVRQVAEVRESWNGAGCDSLSVSINKKLGKELTRALDNYLHGCPAHNGSVFCSCGWYARGSEKLNLPKGWK